MNQDKGHKNAFKAFVESINNNNNIEPIPFEEIFISSAATFAAYESLLNQDSIDFQAFLQSFM